MQEIDLYSGYEYYGEIILTEESSLQDIIFKVKILEFHFGEVLSNIPLGKYDADSVMNNYFRCSGWFDGKWECKRIQEFYDQLLRIENLPINYTDIYNALKQICYSALQSGNKLFIELD